jgi:hypothetical protein
MRSSPRHERSQPARRRVTWRTAIVLALPLLLMASLIGPRAARADGRFIDVHGGLLAGGLTGGGSAGTADFFHQISGPGVGAEVGIRLLILDLSFRFMQTFDSSGRGGTISYIPMLGPSIEIAVARHMVLRPSVAAGFGFGTPGPAHAPLSADQISAKGLLVMGKLGVERFVGPVLGLSVHAEGGYHYFVGGSGLINGTAASDHSSGWQMGLFGSVVIHLGI